MVMKRYGGPHRRPRGSAGGMGPHIGRLRFGSSPATLVLRFVSGVGRSTEFSLFSHAAAAVGALL